MNYYSLKIMVLGGRGVGKITFTEHVGEIDRVAGGRSIRLPPPQTLSFRRLELKENFWCYFWSANYQHPMLDVLLEGMAGFCILIDSTNSRSIYEAQAALKYLTLLDPVPHLVVANKQDREDAMSVGQIRRAMELPAETLILPCVATERASVAHVLNTLLAMIRPDLTERIKE